MNYGKFSFKYSSVLPALSDNEYRELKANIEKNGILVPVVVDEYNNVIDGQHRLKIAQELGLDEVPLSLQMQLSDEEKENMAYDLNLHRRHLSKEQRREIVVKLRQDGMTQGAIAEKLNVGVATVNRDISVIPNGITQLPTTITGKDGKQYPAKKSAPIFTTTKQTTKIEKIVTASEEPGQEYLLDELAETGNIKRGNKEVNRLAKVKTRQETTIEIPSNDNVWHGDFREVGLKIPDNSVDLIFTDPPYDKDAVELYRDLGIFAQRVLKPGGLTLAYSGQIHLPQVLNALGENLDYIWCFAIKHTSGYTRIFKTNSRNMWKPIVLFSKPKYEIWWQTIDDMIDGKMEKDSHEWQQGIDEAKYYLSKLCPEGGLIVDPFCGSGTTLLAAKQLGLKYIGIEDDLEDVNKSIERLQ